MRAMLQARGMSAIMTCGGRRRPSGFRIAPSIRRLEAFAFVRAVVGKRGSAVRPLRPEGLQARVRRRGDGKSGMAHGPDARAQLAAEELVRLAISRPLRRRKTAKGLVSVFHGETGLPGRPGGGIAAPLSLQADA